MINGKQFILWILKNMFDIPKWSMVNNPFYHKSKDSDVLLITVGDSWTYGDSLGKTKVRNGVDDTDYRLSHIYGKLLSDKLNADWTNIALPGGSNEMLITWSDQYLSTDLTKYKSIIYVITLTESGRHLENLWVDKTEFNQQAALRNILLRTYEKLDQLKQKFPSVKFLIGHNFTDSLKSFPVLDKTWLEVLVSDSIQNETYIVVSDHIIQMNHSRKFEDRLVVVQKALQRISVMDQCLYCNKEDSRHPTEQGHILWADYLLTKL